MQADQMIPTTQLGLLLKVHTPKSAKNRHRSKYRCIFDTGIEILVPGPLFEIMQFELAESAPKRPQP